MFSAAGFLIRYVRVPENSKRLVINITIKRDDFVV